MTEKKEYIEREAYYRQIDNLSKGKYGVYCAAINDCMNALDEQPAADVVEVVHGEWIDCNEYDGNLKCSLCEEHYPWGVAVFYRYCPNCGAKMDGERKEQG